MSYIYTNIPQQNIYILSEFLTSGKEQGKKYEAVLTGCRAFHGHGIVFEAYIPEYGAMYDKLPLNAFVHKTPSYDIPYSVLELWDAPSYYMTCYSKTFIEGCVAFMWDGSKYHKGTYLFTLDFAPPHNEIDLTETMLWEEAKSKNFIELDNGQYALVPNNRMRVYLPSLTPPNFLENKPQWTSPSSDWKSERRTTGVGGTVQWGY